MSDNRLSFRTEAALPHVFASARIFAYARVSTAGQNLDTQLAEIRAAGFLPEPRRIVAETVSGSTAASLRPGFARLLDRLEAGDVLVVTRLDRLGRNAMDVRATVERLAALGVRVHCLALGGVDLASAAGRMTMQVIAAVAEFERDLLVERTKAGLARVRAAGGRIGRPPALALSARAEVLARLALGESVSALARAFATSRQTILRLRAGAGRDAFPKRALPG
jgi:putative DNA-invertase from lambdoid prophage Rac